MSTISFRVKSVNKNKLWIRTYGKMSNKLCNAMQCDILYAISADADCQYAASETDMMMSMLLYVNELQN
jgi:hypothetical protein